MNRQRVAAVIIQNKKILLVRDDKTIFFGIPGGTLEDNENQISALTREILEEIGVPLEKARYYYSIDHTNQIYNVPQTDHIYIVSIKGIPIPSSEISELGWFSKDDLENKTVKIYPIFYDNIFPKLVKENFL
ncbi:MAG: NUDIX domain-containing protein [Parcubacteria group bacterium]|jgi:8-oxo-dGTP pyrophosphatase MutT (NUDIX family)